MSIILENVSFAYSENRQVLSHVNLNIPEGEFVGIMGKTGCGKTTLIQIIAGLLSPVEGRVFLDGKDIFQKEYDRMVLREQIGIVFQYPEYQLFETTVEKDVAFGLKYRGLSKEIMTSRVKEAMEQVGLDYESMKNQSPYGLSGGEKRKVAIAGILATKPRVLIFDEPVAGLDPNGREEFLTLVSKLNEQGTTILMISHNSDALCSVAQRLILLEDGEIALDGTTAKVVHSEEFERILPWGKPFGVEIANAMKRRGIGFSEEVTTVNELTQEILRRWGGNAHE